MYLLTLASNNYFKLFQTRVESDFLRAGECIGKRKVKQNAAINNNKTPKESLPDAEFALEYEGENSAKYANRNSKGKQNEAFLQTPHFCGIIKVFNYL